LRFFAEAMVLFNFCAGVFPQKTPRQIIFSILLSDRFHGASQGDASAGVAAAAPTTAGLLERLDGLPKHLTPVLVILKHVKTGTGW